MKFINRTNNTICLEEIDKNIPFLGEQEQSISANEIKKSPLFQGMCIQKKLIITGDCNDRIEKNLLAIQKGYAIPVGRKPIDVALKGQFYVNTGFGKANRNLLHGLLRAGCNVTIESINQTIEGLNEIEIQQLDLLAKHRPEKSILIHSSVPSFTTEEKASYSILYTTVESTSVPNQFVKSCDMYDEVWTTSTFCKDILHESGVSRPIFVIPNSINTGLYYAKAKPLTLSPKLKDFVFISVFGWNYRKGYDALIKAYLKAFKGHDNVSLLIVSKYNYDSSGKCKIEQEIQDLIKQYGGDNPAHISRCGRSIPEFEMPRLYRASQCFVLPSRGEGFGLPYMEASLCGLPVIATNHSGHTMFLNNENSFLVDVDNISRVKDKMKVHYWDGELFPELVSDSFITSLSDTMRLVHSDYQSAITKNELLKQEILANYTIDKIGEAARERLDLIWKNL